MNDWRVFRPAIWLGMLGIAVMLLVSPVYIGILFLGGALGVGVRIEMGRRRIARGTPPRRRRR
jgi:hypothetical protein